MIEQKFVEEPEVEDEDEFEDEETTEVTRLLDDLAAQGRTARQHMESATRKAERARRRPKSYRNLRLSLPAPAEAEAT